jgi:hypothetical protein
VETYFAACSTRIADVTAMTPDVKESAERTPKISHDLLSRLTLHARKIWIGTDVL